MKKPNHSQPPSWAKRLLGWYCHENLLDEIEGDLTEQFFKNVEQKGLRQAKYRYAMDVIRFFHPSSFKNTVPAINLALFASYFTVAIRVFRRDKAFTLTNVLGLSLAIICSGFIFLLVHDELKFNDFPRYKERICCNGKCAGVRHNADMEKHTLYFE